MDAIFHTRCTFSIIILLLLIQRSLKAKAIAAEDQHSNKIIAKRGYSAGNDFGPAIHVASDLLQLGEHTSSETHAEQHYDAAASNPWQSSDLTPGYEVWLNTDNEGLQNYQPIHVLESDGAHVDVPHGAVGGGGIFSTDQQHTSYDFVPVHMVHVPTLSAPSLDGHLSGVLHTQITSSSGIGSQQHKDVVTGNVDFGNDAHLKASYPSKSYGR